MNTVNLKNIANTTLKQSNNPLGVTYKLKPYTIYTGLRLKRYKKRPDELVFLERPLHPNHKLSNPVIHTTNGILFKKE